MATDTDRPLRGCDVCKQVDNHPRHVVAVRDARAQIRHLDCCAADGCDICQATEKATKGVRGDDLLAAIQGGALEKVEV